MAIRKRFTLEEIKAANSGFRDALLRHRLEYERWLNTEEMTKAWTLMRESEARLLAKIESGLGTSFTQARLDTQLQEIRGAMKEFGGALKRRVSASAIDGGKHHAEWLAGALGKTPGAVAGALTVQKLSPALLKTLVSDAPFSGGKLAEWVSRIEANTLERVTRELRGSILRGETVADAVKTLRGTKAAKYADGILQGTRREVQTLVQSIHGAVLNNASEALYKENDDIVQGLQWIATLDDSTCEICGPRDGLVYTLDYEPVGHEVPYDEGPGNIHPNCRCDVAPVLDLPTRDEFRASMDGQVSGKERFPEWAQRQPRERLVELFGEQRADLVLSGKIKVANLWTQKGDFLSLQDLKRREGLLPKRKVTPTPKPPPPPPPPPEPTGPPPLTEEEARAAPNFAADNDPLVPLAGQGNLGPYDFGGLDQFSGAPGAAQLREMSLSSGQNMVRGLVRDQVAAEVNQILQSDRFLLRRDATAYFGMPQPLYESAVVGDELQFLRGGRTFDFTASRAVTNLSAGSAGQGPLVEVVLPKGTRAFFNATPSGQIRGGMLPGTRMRVIGETEQVIDGWKVRVLKAEVVEDGSAFMRRYFAAVDEVDALLEAQAKPKPIPTPKRKRPPKFQAPGTPARPSASGPPPEAKALAEKVKAAWRTEMAGGKEVTTGLRGKWNWIKSGLGRSSPSAAARAEQELIEQGREKLYGLLADGPTVPTKYRPLYDPTKRLIVKPGGGFDAKLPGVMETKYKQAIEKVNEFFSKTWRNTHWQRATSYKAERTPTIALREQVRPHFNDVLHEIQLDFTDLSMGYQEEQRMQHFLKSAVHEMAHRFEYDYQHIKKATYEFLTKRIGADKALQFRIRSMNSETYFADKFGVGNEYSGKVYLKKAPGTLAGKVTYNPLPGASMPSFDDFDVSELLSTGFDRMWQNPTQFYIEDREFFEFIVDVMAGAV